MCENRERLIGYVYDESDPAERAEIEAHLETCHTCRREIRGLKGVRQDLLAWDVPASEPVWRPIAAVPEQSPWRVVPAWAFAAAACAMFMVGAAGGAATYALMPRAAATVAQAPPATAPVATPASLSANDLAVLETKMMDRVRAELDARQTATAAGLRTVSDPETGGNGELVRRVNMLTARQNDLYDRLLEFASETQGIRAKQTGLERTNSMLVNYMQGGSAGAGGQ